MLRTLRPFADVEFFGDPVVEASMDDRNGGLIASGSRTAIGGEALPLIFVEPSSCLAQFLQPYLWLIHIFEICVGAAAILMNGAAGVATFYADRPHGGGKCGQVFPLRVRRAFALMAFNYALLAAVIVGKRCVALVALYHPCVTVVSALNCRLQEFPLVLAFTHAAALPLALAFAHRCTASSADAEHKKAVDWTRCFSLTHVLLLIGCASVAFHFTAFDEADFGGSVGDGGPVNLFQKCSILVAIDRQRAFWLISSLMALYFCGAVLYTIVGSTTATLSASALRGQGGAGAKLLTKPKLNDYETCYHATVVDDSTVPLIAQPSVDEKESKKELAEEEKSKVGKNSVKSLIKKEVSIRGRAPLTIGGRSVPQNPYGPHVYAVKTTTPKKKKSVWIVESAVESRRKRAGRVVTVVESDEVVAFRAAAQALHVSFRDVVLLEAAGWLTALLGSGAALAAEHVVLRDDAGGRSRNVCPRCTFLALELFFSVAPLLIAVGHAMLSMWLILPIRRAAIQLFPAVLGRALPAPEPATPPLPDVFLPAERRNAADERKGEMDVIDWSTMSANRQSGSLAVTPRGAPIRILVTSCESEPNVTVTAGVEQIASSQAPADERRRFAERRTASVE